MTSSVSTDLMTQVEGIKNIPGLVLQNWPAFIGFAAVNWGKAVIESLVPRMGGNIGMLERMIIGGFDNVVTMVTWEQLKMT